jgi:hypothetical protein
VHKKTPGIFYNLENIVWLSKVNLHIITVDEVRNIEMCSYCVNNQNYPFCEVVKM